MTPLDYLAKEYVELTMVKQRYDLDDVYFFVDRPFWKRDLTTSSSRQRGCSNA